MADPDFIPATPDFIPAAAAKPAPPKAAPEQPGFWNTLGREASSAGQAMIGLPGQMLSGITSPPQGGEEKAATALGGPAGLLMDRSVVQPVKTAAKWYYDAARGRIPDPVGQMLSVAPEAIGGAAGNVVGMKAAPALAENAVPLAKSAAVIAKPALKTAGYTAESIPVLGGLLKGAREFASVPGKLGEIWRKPAAPPVEAPAPPATPAPIATPSTGLKGVEPALEKATGATKLEPNVPLKDQLTKTPEHLGQFARANGTELDQALSAAQKVKVHALSNVQVRQLAINLGEDMGQDVIGRAKASGAVPRSEIFGRLLKDHSPAEIVKAIDEGKHLPAEAK